MGRSPYFYAPNLEARAASEQQVNLVYFGSSILYRGVMPRIVDAVLVVIPWGHGENRYRLPYMFPILMFSVLSALRGRAVLAQWARPTARTAGRVAVLMTLVVLFLILNFSRLPTLLAP